MTSLQLAKIQHLNSVNHEGKVILVATDSDGKLWYAVKQDGFEDSYLNTPEAQRSGWENWQALPLPDETADASVERKEAAEFTYQADPDKYLLRSRYKTTTLSSVAPVQLVSGFDYLYVFRQSTTNTLLMDRFILNGLTNTLNRKMEVRYQRKREKFPDGQQMKISSAGRMEALDTPDFRDMSGKPFFEPTTEVSCINCLENGWFSVVLVPTINPDVARWHIFAYNSDTTKVEVTTLRASQEGLLAVNDDIVFDDGGDGLLPRSIPGLIRHTLDIAGNPTVTDGVSAAKYYLQQAQEISQAGTQKTQLLKTGFRVMLTVATS